MTQKKKPLAARTQCSFPLSVTCWRGQSPPPLTFQPCLLQQGLQLVCGSSAVWPSFIFTQSSIDVYILSSPRTFTSAVKLSLKVSLTSSKITWSWCLSPLFTVGKNNFPETRKIWLLSNEWKSYSCPLLEVLSWICTSGEPLCVGNCLYFLPRALGVTWTQWNFRSLIHITG